MSPVPATVNPNSFLVLAFLLFTLVWFPHRLGMENICEELLRTMVMSPP